MRGRCSAVWGRVMMRGGGWKVWCGVPPFGGWLGCEGADGRCGAVLRRFWEGLDERVRMEGVGWCSAV